MLIKYATQITELIGIFSVFLGALYTISLSIKGDQPDKFIKKILDFTTKFSRKK